MTPVCSDQCCTKEPSPEMRTLLCQNSEGHLLLKPQHLKKTREKQKEKVLLSSGFR